jgi:hypothetical protein
LRRTQRQMAQPIRETAVLHRHAAEPVGRAMRPAIVPEAVSVAPGQR